MAGIWVCSEDANVTKQLLTAGKLLTEPLQQPLCALTLEESAAAELVACGADKVIVLKGEGLWPESYAAAVAKITEREDPVALLIGGTMRGKDLAAKVAAHLQSGLVTDAQVLRVENGAIETERMMYGGLAVCTETLSGLALVTIPPRKFEVPPKEESRAGEIVVEAVSTEDAMIIGNVCPIVKQGADISIAEKLVCVGRGLGKEEDMALVRDLAAALGAEIGCTRSVAEDYHWLPSETYIGLSGQKVKPNLYLSVGVSGQVQHVAGIRDSKVIVAVDTNENAPIFAAADYGIVGDLYQIVPLLTKAVHS
ncbi:electron transfer flavoprotein subunit alpha/FixB family protein [uncultured Anaeromusa sp.]|uniref:electron transfer flavoprotein subunit alpha/FixB family protein n=1 Tax=uncultured Anaeromusa sp. TaxID=673273 RepID=UPI0029C97A12|nr:electron transfer flavoprotein subunit alpha/FixB family protein [uncultured Anaeromusa sp.]